MNTNEYRVREFAYQIWESEGRPHGQEDRHWDMACKLADAHAEGGDQLQAAIANPNEIVASGATAAKKSRSKVKSADASSLSQEATSKPNRTKKPKSTEEISV